MILKQCNGIVEEIIEEANCENDIDKSDSVEDRQCTEVITFSADALKYIGRKVKQTHRERYTRIGEKYNMCFKMMKSDSRLVKTLLFSYGFIQCSTKNSSTNLFWTNTHVGSHTLRALKSWQRINHFPRSFMITKKDTLYCTIDRAMVQHGSCYDFIPEYYSTPLSERKMVELKAKCVDIQNGHSPPFIVKPASSSQGRNITFLNGPEDVDNIAFTDKLLISRYVDRPYLINKLKSDLRVYVMVSSFYPLIAYIYNDGLARFAVHEYDETNRRNYSNVNAHLTNYSLNKTSENFVKNSDCQYENVGHKWTLSAFLRRLVEDGVDTELLMVRIEDIIIKTLLSIQSVVAASCRKLNIHPKCCFELFGFDILVDEDLKPWLLEVNLSPSLVCDAPLDAVLKTKLLCDTLNIASIPLICDRNTLNKCATEDAELDNVTDSSSPSTSAATPSLTSVVSDATLSTGNNSGTDDGNLSRKRKINSRASKIKRAQLNLKSSYSAENVTPLYLSRARLHYDKLISEDKRKGSFIRVFPRRMTWSLYSSILDDVGQEKWDKNLHDALDLKDGFLVTARDVNNAHDQLLDAKNYPRREDLSPKVRDVILKDALAEAAAYKEHTYEHEENPYPKTLPRVRTPARKRTRSMLASEEVRMQQNAPVPSLPTDPAGGDVVDSLI